MICSPATGSACSDRVSSRRWSSRWRSSPRSAAEPFMSGELDSFDFGPRSNDSDFAGLDGPVDPAPVALHAPSVAAGEALPFRVAIADSEAQLARVQRLREAAYGHHLPGLAAHFGEADPVDRW